MSVIVDLTIIAVITLCAVRHYKLGLFCSVLNVGKFIAAIILAGILRIPLSALALRLIYGEGDAGAIPTALVGMISYVVIFAAVIAVSGFIIKKVSKIEIPIITRFDKLLGLALGLVIGAALASLLSTALFTVIEFVSDSTNNADIMNVYDDSFLFKFFGDVSLFEFVRDKI